MKTVHQLTESLLKQMPYTTSFEKTRLLVEVDRMVDKSYRDYRIELTEYSVRYKASDKTIYIYNKIILSDDSLTEYIGNIDIPDGYKIKMNLFKNNRGVGNCYEFRKNINEIKSKIINRVFRH